MDKKNMEIKPMLSDSYLEEVKRRYKATTKGPWISIIEGRDQDSGDSFIMVDADGDYEAIYLLGATTEDQDFMANARQDIPNLLDEIYNLKSIINELKNKQ